jgi:hypothetical protein
MSQKYSLPQLTGSVSGALTPDSILCRNDAGILDDIDRVKIVQVKT